MKTLLSNERDHENPVINEALNEIADKESVMTENEIKLRDQLNKEISQKGMHLRLASVHVKDDGFVFDFVRPIDQWFDEWPEVDRYVTERLHQLAKRE